MSNGNMVRRKPDRETLAAFREGWDDVVKGRPWSDAVMSFTAAHNYEAGRLTAVEARAAGVPVKPWGRPTVHVYPDHVWRAALAMAARVGVATPLDIVPMGRAVAS